MLPSSPTTAVLFVAFKNRNTAPRFRRSWRGALSSVANTPLIISCAGRTDTGVHASHQVIHFDTTAQRDGRNWILGANSRLPDSISLVWAGQVSQQFHARFSATARTYRYVIWANGSRPAILSKGVSWVRHPLDTEVMRQACQYLLGEQDFSAFRGAGCQSNSPWRNITHAKVVAVGQMVVFEVTANICAIMVRNMVGSLLEVVMVANSPSGSGVIAAARDRRKSASTAAPYGLYLVDVEYPEEFAIPSVERGPMFLPDSL